MVVVAESHGILGGGMGSESFGLASQLIDQVNVELSFAIGSESDALSVGAPHGARVVGRMGGQLVRLAASGGHGEEVSLIGEGDGLSVGR